MHVRAILKGITQLAGGEASATVQLVGTGNFQTFHDGYAVSHAIPRSLLTPGADVVVDIPDLYHPGDGHVVSVAAVSAAASGSGHVEQFGNTLVATDGSGNGSGAVVFANTYGSFTSTPTVALSAAAANLGSGTISATAVTVSGFTVNVAGAPAGSAVPVAWDAQG